MTDQKNITQSDIDNKAKEFKSNIPYALSSRHEFLKNNYKILYRKKNPVYLDLILINDCINNSLDYRAPECIDFSIDTICFYLALDYYKISDIDW